MQVCPQDAVIAADVGVAIFHRHLPVAADVTPNAEAATTLASWDSQRSDCPPSLPSDRGYYQGVLDGDRRAWGDAVALMKDRLQSVVPARCNMMAVGIRQVLVEELRSTARLAHHVGRVLEQVPDAQSTPVEATRAMELEANMAVDPVVHHIVMSGVGLSTSSSSSCGPGGYAEPCANGGCAA